MDELEPQNDKRRPGIDRRTLIKGAAAAGVAAWTAPVIIDSVTSPAGASTGTPGCFKFTVTPATCVNSLTAAFDTTCDITTTQCSVTTEGAGQPFTKYCLTASTCNDNANVTFTINAGCSCTFLAARAETNNATGGSGCGGTLCVTGTIAGGGKTATFTKPGGGGCRWVAWNLIVQCA